MIITIMNIIIIIIIIIIFSISIVVVIIIIISPLNANWLILEQQQVSSILVGPQQAMKLAPS